MGGVRAAWVGFALGSVLAFGRAPLGLDWVRLAAVDGPTAAAVRAAALLLVAAVLALAARRGGELAPRSLALGLLAGFAAAALGLEGWLPLDGRSQLAAAVVLPALAAAWLVRGARGGGESERPARGELVGVVIGASGAAIALETLARPTRSLGLALAEDDALLGSLVLALVAAGACFFGPLVSSGAPRRWTVQLGPLAVALGAWIGWWFLTRLQHPRGIAGQAALLGATSMELGTWRWDAALGVPAFVLPAFALGAWLAAARAPARVAALALGGALGTLLVAWLRDGTAGVLVGDALAGGTSSRIGLSVGAALAAAGGALAALGAGATAPADARRRARATAAVATGAGVLVLAVAPRPLLLLSPWHDAPVEAEWLLETSDGLLAIERTRFGERIATLDRRLLVPLEAHLSADFERLRVALAALDQFALGGRSPRVLFVGLLTPARSALLAAHDGLVLERTAPWHPWDGVLEDAFAAGAPLAGTRVAPAEARARLRAGEYDLVVAAPAQGVLLAGRGLFDQAVGPPPRPSVAALDAPPGTAAIAWIEAAAGLAPCALGERVLLASQGLEQPHVGLLRGDARHWPSGSAPGRRASLPAGARAFGAPAALRLVHHARDRAADAHRRVFRRLADAAAGTPHEPLADALARHFAAQRLSAVWAARAEAVELDDASLARFSAAALSAPGDPFVEGVLEDLARVLVEKRFYEELLEHVEPVADARRPWLALEQAVIAAYRALLAPEPALARVVALIAERPGDAELWLERGELESELARADAARSLDRAEELGLETYEARRRLARARMALGDPRGFEQARALVAENPLDEALRAELEEAPVGPPAPR